MDINLFDRIHRDLPKINERILDGLAVEHMKPERVMNYISTIISCAQEQYPKGLRFEGCERCTPIEEYNVITRSKNGKRGSNKRMYDLAKSYVYLVKFNFSYAPDGDESKREKLYPQYLYLPYVKPGGLICISGKLWSISPVLADKLFSVGDKDVFIRMPRAPVTFYQTSHGFNVDGVRVPNKVVYSTLHNKKGKSASSASIIPGRVNSTMMHYLLCKYGFYETFRRYGHTDVKVMHESEATVDKYPVEDWVICTSSKIKPVGVRIRTYAAIASDIALVIPRTHFTPLVKSMVAGFYYVVDHFPEAMEVEYITDPNIDPVWQWRVLMGHILWGDEPTQNKLVEDVESHLKSLDGYVDYEVRRTMRMQKVYCENIYDLFIYIIENMTEMLLSNSSQVSSMYGKQLMILRYVLSDINNEMFQFLFKITSNNKKAMNKETIEGILSDYFKPKLIFRITSGTSHGEVSSVASPGDNKFFKVTSVLVQQSETAGKGKSHDTKPVDPSLYLDASQAEVAGYNVLPKSNPFGRNRINPFLNDDPDTGDIYRNPKFIELLDGVQRRIKR